MGHWQMGVGKTLRGRTLGLYGYGRIAKAVEVYALAFGMNVLWWASEEGQSRAKADGKTVAKSRSEFFATPDVISVHLRLNDTTRGIVTAEDFADMRDDALFVNTSRAGLLEQGALLDALNAGRPAAAALDVFESEPPGENPLFELDNVVCTPHLGASTAEAQENVAIQVAEQMSAYLNTGAVTNALNIPSVSAEDAKKLKPYLNLVELLGSFTGQITETGLKNITIEYK